MEVRRVLAKHPAKVKLDQFLFKFDGGTTKEPTPEDLAARTAASKAAWTALLKTKGPAKNG